ncbi:MAG: DegV family protein [Clostridiales bacterium]|jgi:DegV family protein with EDD domain|nr:DegV family protein [Clostridiales bacterium]
MINNYVLMTDSDSDLPWQYAHERQIPVVQMPYSMEGVEYFDDNGKDTDLKAFYDKMRGGATPVTSLLPTAVYLDLFEPILKEHDLLFLAFSSKMSATFNNVLEAQKELQQKYPHRKFIVVDTLCISYPMTVVIKKAYDLYAAGATMEEVEKWVLENRTKVQAWFTVDDLVYLRRGGRISSTSAIAGSMLNIKPILTITKAGKLEAHSKVQGSKKAMKALVDKVAENILNPEDQEVIVMHADAPEEVRQLEQMLRQRVPGIGQIACEMIGPVIGAHAGPGTLAVTFMGKERVI